MSATVGTLNVQALLRELEASGDWDVQESLFLTFNADVGFLERGILGLCQSMGARVTVIADAGMWRPDPLAMKGAGTDYMVGLAANTGAFHPKLALLIADDRVLALIGSGNLTMGGWQHNSELWTVLRSEDGHAPQAVFEIAEWLDLLPHHVRLGTGQAAALHRVAARLRATLERLVPSHSDTQLITNLHRSLVSQLPAGPVDELTLYAPFVDEHASAVRALVDRFPTPKLTIVVQPMLTVIEPQALARVLKSQAGLTVVADTSRRYRHAKLVEWRRGSHRQALTGSANLSAAAMLRIVGQGGNIELGVLSSIEEPLWPDPQLQEDDYAQLENITDIPAVRLESPDGRIVEHTIPRLLSAELSGNALTIELAHSVSFDVDLEYTNNPLHEPWKRLGIMMAGHDTESFSADRLTDSALLRLSWAEANTAVAERGPAVPASVPERLRMRPSAVRSAGGLRIKSREDLLGEDLRYLDAFASQLSQIAEDVSALRNPSAASSRTPAATADVSHIGFAEEPTPWLWELEQVAQNLHGPAFSGFALGLPSAPASTAWENFESDESGELDADVTSFDDEELAPEFSVNVEPKEPVIHAKDPERIKRARRERIKSFARIKARLSTISYLGLTRLALCFYCAGNWDENDPEPITLVTYFLSKAIDQADSASLRAEANALTAVALTCVRRRVDYTTTSPATQAAKRMHEKCGQLDFEAVPLPLVAEYTQCLSTVGGRPLETADVYDELETFNEHPLLDSVIMAAESHGHTAEVLGPNSLQLLVRSREPLRAALKVLAASTVPTGLRAKSLVTGKSAIALWSAPDLFCIELDDKVSWKHYRSERGLNVILAALSSAEAARFRVPHGPFNKAIPEAKQLAERVGIRIRIPRQADIPPGVCPECFMQLTPAGDCGTCDP